VAPINIVKLETHYYRVVQYTLALKYAKNRIIIFCSFLDILENVAWPRFLAHPVYSYRAMLCRARYCHALVVTLWTCYGALQIVILLLLLLLWRVVCLSVTV